MILASLREVLAAKMVVATADARDEDASPADRDEALLEAAGISALFALDRCATALERIADAVEQRARPE